MSDSDTTNQNSGSKEKISKWKLYKTQIKRLKESSKPEVLTSAKGGVVAELMTLLQIQAGESQGEVLLDSGSGIDITLNTGDTSEAEAGQAEKQ